MLLILLMVLVGCSSTTVYVLNKSEVDQFSFICKSFEKDKFTRQAIINIGDPPKDCFDKEGNLKIA